MSARKYKDSDIVMSTLGGINQDDKFAYGNLVITTQDLIYHDKKTEAIVPLINILKVETIKGGPVFVVTLKDGGVKEYRSGEAKVLVKELENRLIKDEKALERERLAEVGRELQRRAADEETERKRMLAEEEKERQWRLAEAEMDCQRKKEQEELENQRLKAAAEKKAYRDQFEGAFLKDILNEETIMASFQFNDLETLYITSKRAIIIGKRFSNVEAKDAIPVAIPGASLLRKVKSIVQDDEEPMLYVQSIGCTMFPDLLLEEIKVEEQTMLDVGKEKVKEAAKIQGKKPRYTHKLTIDKCKSFDIQEAYLPDVWRVFRYAGKS